MESGSDYEDHFNGQVELVYILQSRKFSHNWLYHSVCV